MPKAWLEDAGPVCMSRPGALAAHGSKKGGRHPRRVPAGERRGGANSRDDRLPPSHRPIARTAASSKQRCVCVLCACCPKLKQGRPPAAAGGARMRSSQRKGAGDAGPAAAAVSSQQLPTDPATSRARSNAPSLSQHTLPLTHTQHTERQRRPEDAGDAWPAAAAAATAAAAAGADCSRRHTGGRSSRGGNA